MEIWCLCPAPVSRAVRSGFAIQPLPRNTPSMKILQHLLFPQTFLPGNLFARIFEESKQRRSLNTNSQGCFFCSVCHTLTPTLPDARPALPRELPCLPPLALLLLQVLLCLQEIFTGNGLFWLQDHHPSPPLCAHFKFSVLGDPSLWRAGLHLPRGAQSESEAPLPELGLTAR